MIGRAGHPKLDSKISVSSHCNSVRSTTLRNVLVILELWNEYGPVTSGAGRLLESFIRCPMTIIDRRNASALGKGVSCIL